MVRHLRGCERGAATVEFVIVAPVFLLLFFGVIETASAFFWWKTAEKATQLGARLAIVRDPAAVGMPLRNVRRDGTLFGLACGSASDPCDFDNQSTWICSGGDSSCNPDAFDNIITEMRRVIGQEIDDDNLNITYSYVGLGYAGGPFIPAVTVTLTGVRFGMFMGFLSGMAGEDGALEFLPDISATLTGEDLSGAGVGV
ncbi:MAG: TadE/TadG family type IV pilus assembly protein [Geminicoccaceae bacterium]